jgi:DNA-binding FadR family transcriptional regulator
MTALDDEPDARRRPRLSAPRIAEVVAGELRQQIIDGELADGDFLPRQDLLVERWAWYRCARRCESSRPRA